MKKRKVEDDDSWAEDESPTKKVRPPRTPRTDPRSRSNRMPNTPPVQQLPRVPLIKLPSKTAQRKFEAAQRKQWKQD